MRKRQISSCPVCDGELVVTSLKCKNCFTEIKGEFKHDKFSLLDEEDREFMEIFILNRGNIKEIEKTMNISYPTVRNKLDKLIRALGHNISTDYTRLEILERLDRGEISSEDAAEMLKYV